MTKKQFHSTEIHPKVGKKLFVGKSTSFKANSKLPMSTNINDVPLWHFDVPQAAAIAHLGATAIRLGPGVERR